MSPIHQKVLYFSLLFLAMVIFVQSPAFSQVAFNSTLNKNKIGISYLYNSSLKSEFYDISGQKNGEDSKAIGIASVFYERIFRDEFGLGGQFGQFSKDYVWNASTTDSVKVNYNAYLLTVFFNAYLGRNRRTGFLFYFSTSGGIFYYNLKWEIPQYRYVSAAAGAATGDIVNFTKTTTSNFVYTSFSVNLDWRLLRSMGIRLGTGFTQGQSYSKVSPTPDTFVETVDFGVRSVLTNSLFGNLDVYHFF